MSWIPIKEYIQKFSISDSTIRRKIRTKKLKAKQEDGKWFIWAESQKPGDGGIFPDGGGTKTESTRALDSKKFDFLPSVKGFPDGGTISEIISFSSKALNSYLMASDKLILEKDKRIEEKDEIITRQNQKISELESYVKILEEIEKRLKELKENTWGWR